MTDTRPDANAATQLTSHVSATDTTIPVLTTSIFALDTRKRMGEAGEFIQCTGIQQTPWPALTGCSRGLSPEEGGVAPRAWDGGTPIFEVPWTAIEIVTAIPVPTRAMVGRQFLYKDASGNVYTFNVVISPAGDPVIDWINEPPLEEAVEGVFSLDMVQKVNPALSNMNGIAVASDGSYLISRDTPGGGVVETMVRKYSLSNVIVWTRQDFGVGTGDDTRHLLISSLIAGKYFADLNRIDVGRYNYTSGSNTAEAFTDLSASTWRPGGMTTDGTTVWATDTQNALVRAFTNNPTVLTSAATFGAPGSATGQFNNPTDIFYSGGKLFVLDAGNGRVQRFDATTNAFEMSFGAPGNVPGQISSTADSLVVDTLSRIWVSDTGNHRVNLYDSAGVFLADAGTLGSGANQFNSPRQLALAVNGVSVHVIDRGNKRIMTVQEHVDLNLALNYSAYDWDEEFIGGGLSSGTIGERGWTLAISAGAAASAQSSTSSHPGLLRLSTGATSANSIRITLGPWLLAQMDKLGFIFAPASNASTGSARMGVGIGGGTNPLNNPTPSEGVSVEYDAPTSAGFMVVCKYIGGVATKTVSTIPFVAGEFYLAELSVTNVGEVTVRVLRLSDGTEQSIVLTGISTTAQFDATFFARTTAATSKTLDPDYWSGSFSGLTRV
jgi:hypothetical protein